jgi:4'-phosphopantetheinyl transferase EntD
VILVTKRSQADDRLTRGVSSSRCSLLGELLPGDVATAESVSVTPDAPLFPAELALIDRAVPKRRAEFTAARQCARHALSHLGIGPVPILSGAHREPLWPAGVVGSITHCDGYHAAAVARGTRFRSIGIDAEPDGPLPGEVLDRICLSAERAQLRGTFGCHPDRLLFCAKESVYKAWFPLARRWLGFEDAFVTLRPDGRFDVEVKVSGPIEALHGRWLARDGLILTAAALPR